MSVVRGIKLGVAQAGIKKPGKDDLTIIEIIEGASVAATFTRNAFCAAPVHVARAHLTASNQRARYWVINTGNANAGTGDAGMHAARATCDAVAELAACSSEAVMPFSTGVIGELLPAAKIVAALPAAFADLKAAGWERAASAILTTDTRPKLVSKEIALGGGSIVITGMSKGAGMIRPDMATMLAFVATDLGIDANALDTLFRRAVNASFNRITVDGDTSTNDAAVIAATGCSSVDYSALSASDQSRFDTALTEVCIELAQLIIRDGEGATKFVEVQVNGGATPQECEDVAYTIAHSPLVKTALFASDPNWGRLLAAIGRAGLERLVVENVSLYLNDVLIAEHGARAASYTEEQGVAAMAPEDIVIRVELNRGNAKAAVWTTDFSYDYVKINAEYRT
ncbi:MAG: bifunctional glutamate N-acetyltransferase/amino-acid acetyltransferase ArgJ [Pseudomonadota bacterium]